ncbi:SNF2 domain-containing protein / helicase domain-containing protein isoform X1 [Carex rostrata]
MGLGKTLQAISLLSYLKTNSMSHGPFLILCPLSVTDGWLSEFRKFCPSLRVMSYVGDKGHRFNLRSMIHDHVKTSDELPFDVLLTTYDIALMDQHFLSQIPFHYAVIDEAQRLKNSSSVLYNVLEKQYIMPRRLLLTGTPIQNNLTELWALLHFCMPSVFGTLDEFTSTFKQAGISMTGSESETVKSKFKTLKHILQAFMLRRTKSLLVESGALALPPLTEITVLLPLVPLQEKLYVSVLRKELQTLLSFAGGASSHQSLQNIVIQLRKACSHPYLFNGIEPEPYKEGEHLVQASGKLIVLDQLLKKLYELGHRVLLFAQMTHTLDILQDFLELRKYTYERLDGSVRAEERFAAIRRFSVLPNDGSTKHPEGQNDPFVFMISTRAGGVGLNLVGADTVIFYEQDWNPQADKQALQRAHRIGQLNHVLSINLVTERTIEEVIMRRAERKLKLSHSIIGQDKHSASTKNDTSIETGDMRSLIFGLHTFDPSDTNPNSNSDLNSDILSEERITKLDEMTDRVVNMRNRDLLSEVDHTFEINQTNLKSISDKINLDPGLDEAAYRSWIEKFKEASGSVDSVNLELERRKNSCNSEEREARREIERKRKEENKLAKWDAVGYRSLAVEEPENILNESMDDTGGVQFVYGDCTDPYKICPSKPAIIFSCVDNSGSWGRGGMFTALMNLSSSIPDAYEKAHECADLHMGDLHLIELEEANCNRNIGAPLWVALAVVQSYSARRKVPRSPISIPDLEVCLSKASFSAAQKSASIHMPRIGYQDGSQRSVWYIIERLLKKYASLHSINIYVYYYSNNPNIVAKSEQ